MRLLCAAAAVFLLVILLPYSARAHGDIRLAKRSLTLEPGQAQSFQGDLHYHRLVGTVRADNPVRVLFVNDRTGETVLESGPSRSIQMNHLIRCCDDLGWAPFTLLIVNEGLAPVEVDLRARLVHDDFAVYADGAEAGAHESIPVLGMIWALVLWRVCRRSKPLPGPARAAGLTAALVIVALGICLYGSARYSAGVVPAFLAGLSDIPLIPANPIVSGTSVLLALFGIAWAWAVVWWVRARHTAEAGPWLGLGAAFVAMIVATGIFMEQAYGNWWVPLAAGIAAMLPVLAVLLIRFTPRQAPALAPE
jgi:hypothetical protein